MGITWATSALTLLAIPAPVLANAGTPLMWAGMLHLAFGNAIIGCIEGAILARVFGLRSGRTIWAMVLANYFSAWVGGLFLGPMLLGWVPLDLYTAWRFLWIVVGVTYAMTLVLEWPFVARCVRGSGDWFRRSVKGSFLVQTATYVPLFGWYWLASGTTLYTQMHIVRPEEIAMPAGVVVYYISAANGSVKAQSLADGRERTVYDLKSRDSEDRLTVRRSAGDTKAWDLIARMETGDDNEPNLITIHAAFTQTAALDWRVEEIGLPHYCGNWDNKGPAAQLASASESAWKFYAGFWAVEGLSGTNAKTGEQFRLCLEMPFVQWWMVRNVTHLPGDHVLFQLGENQICVLDAASKRVAMVARGRGPVAVIEEAGRPTTDRSSRVSP